jgi:hypothetical protein
MTTVDFLLLALALAIAAAVAYLLDSGRLFSRDPYADFDRWQRCFHAGIEARRCGLDPNDNPFEDDVDSDAWVDGWLAADTYLAEEEVA